MPTINGKWYPVAQEPISAITQPRMVSWLNMTKESNGVGVALASTSAASLSAAIYIQQELTASKFVSGLWWAEIFSMLAWGECAQARSIWKKEPERDLLFGKYLNPDIDADALRHCRLAHFTRVTGQLMSYSGAHRDPIGDNINFEAYGSLLPYLVAGSYLNGLDSNWSYHHLGSIINSTDGTGADEKSADGGISTSRTLYDVVGKYKNNSKFGEFFRDNSSFLSRVKSDIKDPSIKETNTVYIYMGVDGGDSRNTHVVFPNSILGTADRPLLVHSQCQFGTGHSARLFSYSDLETFVGARSMTIVFRIGNKASTVTNTNITQSTARRLPAESSRQSNTDVDFSQFSE